MAVVRSLAWSHSPRRLGESLYSTGAPRTAVKPERAAVSAASAPSRFFTSRRFFFTPRKNPVARRVEDGMNPTTTLPAIPAYVSADGGAARLVCTVDGCEVWAVRRLPGYDGRSAWAKEMAPAGPYWTTIVQTRPGREKTQSLDSRRFEENSHGRDAAMRKAVAAIVSHYASETNIARAMHGIAEPAIVWHDADAAQAFKSQTA